MNQNSTQKLKKLERVLLWSVIVLDIAIWLIRIALHDPLIF